MWQVLSVDEDLATGNSPRWLVTYQVPPEYAPDGIYSFSFPKQVINNYAAVFGVDVNNTEDVEDLMDYVTHMAYINEVLRKEGRGDEVVTDPLGVDPSIAWAAIRRQVAEFKTDRPLRAASAAKVVVAGRSARPAGDVHDPIKADMRERLDGVVVAEMALKAVEARQARARMGRQ